jgi:hypothetical protein
MWSLCRYRLAIAAQRIACHPTDLYLAVWTMLVLHLGHILSSIPRPSRNCLLSVSTSGPNAGLLVSAPPPKVSVTVFEEALPRQQCARQQSQRCFLSGGIASTQPCP